MPVPPSRRLVLGASGLLALAGSAALAGCGGPVRAPDPDVSVLLGAIADEETLISLYERITTTYADLPSAFTDALVHHREHLAVLRKHYLPGTGGAPATPTGAPTATEVPVPESRPGAISLLRRSEKAAAEARLADVTGVSPGMSQLFASIGACEAGHYVALGVR